MPLYVGFYIMLSIVFFDDTEEFIILCLFYNFVIMKQYLENITADTRTCNQIVRKESDIKLINSFWHNINHRNFLEKQFIATNMFMSSFCSSIKQIP